MSLWIGVDDTDSRDGMCTTFLATEFARELAEHSDIIGYPRLVRLNPNVPWKTRGNGAVALRIGRGYGPRFRCGEIRGRTLWAYPSGREPAHSVGVVDRLSALVEKWSEMGVPGTNPGLVVLRRRPGAWLYWRAVREIVPRELVEDEVRELGEVRMWGSGLGIIGASAACAWRPRDRTWEILAYRHPELIGSPRNVSAASVRDMDAGFRSTFCNYDYENERVVIAPSTPCPVLFGIRGDDPLDLPGALHSIRGEPPERWLLFETNQGTDDHVLPAPTQVPRSAGTFSGRVNTAPRNLPGGHVVFGLDRWEVTAYEPSKQFRRVARALVPGDLVEVIGSLREDPRTINLEKLRIVEMAPGRVKAANPMCPRCCRRMKSMGRESGYRCRGCGKRVTDALAVYSEPARPIRPGWHEPPTGSRRHLAKPLKRGRPGSTFGVPRHEV